MTAGWVKAFDDSFGPVTDLRAAYAAGFRVWCRYVGPGSDAKHWTAAQIAAWLACGPDTGVGFLAEGVGDEPLTDPAAGTTHAKSARLAMRALGIDPAKVLCSPAVDRNITKAQALGPVDRYMANWTAAYGGRPVAYVEVENGGRLVAAGVSAGTFVPAAYSWNESGELVTPANAPAHVVQTQEHNGVKAYGGTIDTGHIRLTAPHVYWNPKGVTTVARTLTDEDLQAIFEYIGTGSAKQPTNYKDGGKPISLAAALTSVMGHTLTAEQNAAAARLSDAQLAALAGEIAAKVTVPAAGTVDVDALAAAVVAELRAHPLAPVS